MNRINWSLNNHFRCVSFLDANLEGRLTHTHTRTSRKLPKTDREKSKYIKLKNLTVYFLLMKVVLTKKIQFKKEDLKSNV
jgi:hypothetical protein